MSLDNKNDFQQQTNNLSTPGTLRKQSTQKLTSPSRYTKDDR